MVSRELKEPPSPGTQLQPPRGDTEPPQRAILNCLEVIFLKCIFRPKQGVEEPV